MQDDGTPLYNQYMIEENVGAIIVPYDLLDGVVRIGLITQERPVPTKDYIELPRGFGDYDESTLQAAYRELFEETGLLVEGNVDILGRVNPNSTFYRTDILSLQSSLQG